MFTLISCIPVNCFRFLQFQHISAALSRKIAMAATNKSQQFEYGDESASTNASTRDVNEIARFSSLSSDWWNECGSLQALHAMNALRVPWIRGTLAAQGDRNPKALKGINILDVGCGAGILSEPLARLGAYVTGIDASQENIEIAKLHKTLDDEIADLITYLPVSIEEIPDGMHNFDALVASEVVEHVALVDTFLENCVNKVKIGGHLFFTTINKTWLSQVAAIWLAEEVLRIVPRGIHQWQKFVTPQDLQVGLEQRGCHVRMTHGILYNPLFKKWVWINNSSVNYVLHAVKGSSM